MRTLRLTLVALGCLGLLAAGCGSTVNTLEPASPAAQRNMVPDKRVVTDTGFYSHVKILGVNTTTGPAGFLKIQVELENATRSLQPFTYRVEWYDETGMIIPLPTTSAVPKTLEARETASITATAPTPLAKDFRIKFLEGN
jgi:uncharacterized protein YcfL